MLKCEKKKTKQKKRVKIEKKYNFTEQYLMVLLIKNNTYSI